MKITLETDFKTREELDSFIRSRVGDNQEENIKHEVEVTEDEATKLALDRSTRVFGVRVVIK
jgi:uncharacterized protein YpmS